MARPAKLSDTDHYGRGARGEEWQALRGELVTLLDQVEDRYRQQSDEDGYDSLAQRLRDLRYQVADVQPANRHREALASVQRAVDRFSDRDEVPVAVNPRDMLASAITEIRARQTPRVPQAQFQQPQAPAPVAAVPAGAPPQLVERLVDAVSGLTGRLERLEGEIKTTRHGAAEVKTISDQVGQLTQVVELLAGAVGETGQVKRLEGQIADLAATIAAGQKADIGALTRRIEDVAGTVDRLVQLQAEPPRTDGMLVDGLRSIEDSVRAIYDRIDALEKNPTIAPADFDRLTDDMAAFIEEMRANEGNVRPAQLLARVDALNARLADYEGKDGLVGALRADVDALRVAVVEAFEPRFVAIERQLGSINQRLDTPAKGQDAIGKIEDQIRHLIARMDETGAQLANLSKLYAEGEQRQAPDLEALASLVAQKTSAAVSKSRAGTAKAQAINEESLNELEKRLAHLFESRQPETAGPELLHVQDSIKSVDDRLARLEAQLAGPRTGMPVTAPAMSTTTIVPAPSRVADAMPANPGVDAPLVDRGFADTGPVRQALEAKVGAPPSGAQRMREMLLKADSKAEPAPAPAAAGKAGFDPNSAVLPPRPQSSLDTGTRENFGDAPAKTAEPVKPETAAPQAEAGASANTFIAAHRRMAQRQSQDKAEEASNSLLGRAFAGIKARKAGAETTTTSAPAPVSPTPVSAKAQRVPEPEPVVDPQVDEDDEDEGKQSFLMRHRQPILLAATLVAVAFLSLNLISQRMGQGEQPAEAETVSQPDVSAPTEPVAEVSSVQKPAGEVRAIPGTGAEAAIDSLTVGAINPLAATGFSKQQETPVVSMPPMLALSGTPGDANITGATPPDGESPAALDTAPLPPVLPAAPTPPTTLDPALSGEPVAGPVKLDLPPVEIGPDMLREAAANGDARAQFEVAAIYTEGKLVKQDYAEALVWYERAAAQGFAPAQYRLGNLYEAGNGTKKDLEQARLWYQRAAEAGNRMSMHNLAALYAGGTLGKQDFASAAQWFEQAAERGMTDSQFNLGMLYARGLGVAQDMEASYKWFSLAARAGDADAVKARDDVAKSLDAAAVTRMQTMLETWKADEIDLAANFAPIGTWNKDFDPGKPIDNKAVIGKVQAALNKLGFNVGSADGITGPKTAEAIKAFEKATGMSETGAINPRLLAVLGSQPV